MFTRFVAGVVVLVVSVSLSGAQVISTGDCPAVTVKDGFDLSQYLGQWFEQQRYFTIFEVGLDCVSADYSLRSDGDVKVNNTGRNSKGESSVTIGRANIPDPNIPAKLLVRFNEDQPAGDYWVIDTDYNAFTIVYACKKLGPFKTELLWLLSRQRSGYTPAVQQRVEQVLRQQGINPKPLNPINQLNCD